MSALNVKRLPWYAGWLQSRHARRTAAAELLESIKLRHYDSQTLQELHEILQFELLCQALRHQKAGEEVEDASSCSSPIRPSTSTSTDGDDDPFDPALHREWVAYLIETLSGCMIRSINETAHLERELQNRCLLCALSLLHSLNVTALQHNLHDSLRKQLEDRFTDLKWQSGSSGALSWERFGKLQSSYVLCAANEYVSNFKIARPWQHTLLTRVGNLLSFGLMVSSPAWGGGGFNLQETMESLNDGLRSVTQTPNHRYQDLFLFQEITNIASAFQLYARVSQHQAATRISSAMILQHAKDLAKVILEKILNILDDYYPLDFITPPSNFWEQFRASTSRGPPNFDLYYYIYGMIDCATQLRKILDSGHLKMPREDTLQLLVINGREPSLRWKSLEYLLISTDDMETFQGRLFSASDSDLRPRVEKEVSDMRVILDGPSFPYPLPIRQLSIVTVPTSTPDKGHTSGGAKEPTLSKTEWIERNFSSPTISPDCDVYSILPSSKKWYNLSGLSLDCASAFFLDPDVVSVYSTEFIKNSKSRVPMFTLKKVNARLRLAALSDRFLVAVSNDEIQIMAYNLYPGDQIYELPVQRIEPEEDGSKFVPGAVAMYDAPERTWVAVGGQIGRNGVIKIFEINSSMDVSTSSTRNHSFNQTQPDPLKSDFIESLQFSPDGGRLSCTTKNNRVLIWFLSNNGRPLRAPFSFSRTYAVETDVRGITSATVFFAPSSKCYALCTTHPSSERELHGGEFSFLTPVASAPCHIPSRLSHSLVDLRKCGPILAGAAAPAGNIAAVLETTGKIYLFPLKRSDKGGLCAREMVKLKKRLEPHDRASTMALRFCPSGEGLGLFGVDNWGNVVRKLVESKSMRPAYLTRGEEAVAAGSPVSEPTSASERSGSASESLGKESLMRTSSSGSALS